jgi:hypothetical protein
MDRFVPPKATGPKSMVLPYGHAVHVAGCGSVIAVSLSYKIGDDDAPDKPKWATRNVLEEDYDGPERTYAYDEVCSDSDDSFEDGCSNDEDEIAVYDSKTFQLLRVLGRECNPVGRFGFYQAVRRRADQPCGTLTLAGAFVGQTFALVHIFRHAHAHNVPPLLTFVSTECQRSTSVSTLLHAASVANIMQLMQNNIVNLPVFRNSYFQRSYLHSLFITSPCCFKQSHKVTT